MWGGEGDCTELAVLCLVAQSCLTLCNPTDCNPPGSSVHGDSPGINTGVGSLSHLQENFPTQGSNPGLLHCRWILCHLSHQGSPRTLEWVAYSFSSGSSGPRNRTGVSCIAGGFLTNWATREAHIVRTWKYLNLLGRESLARYKKHNRIRWMSSKMFSFFWHQAIRKDLVLSDWD